MPFVSEQPYCPLAEASSKFRVWTKLIGSSPRTSTTNVLVSLFPFNDNVAVKVTSTSLVWWVTAPVVEITLSFELAQEILTFSKADEEVGRERVVSSFVNEHLTLKTSLDYDIRRIY